MKTFLKAVMVFFVIWVEYLKSFGIFGEASKD